MPIKVHIPAPMRQHTDGQATVDATGGTVKQVLDNGQLRRFVNVYLNDEDIRYLDNLDSATKDGDEVSIIPAVAGG